MKRYKIRERLVPEDYIDIFLFSLIPVWFVENLGMSQKNRCYPYAIPILDFQKEIFIGSKPTHIVFHIEPEPHR